MRHVAFLFVLAINLLVTGTARADIRVTYSTDPAVSGAPYAGHPDGDELLFGTFSATSTQIAIPIDPQWQVVRVRSTLPTEESLPPLVLTGDRSNGVPVRLIVGTATSDADRYPQFNDRPIGAAALNYHGLSFAEGSEALQNQTVLALAITGDTVGPTTVGAVRRFQVWGPSLTSGGNILAPITATAGSDPAHNTDSPQDQFGRPSPSIGYITATNSIDAPITAPSGNILHVDVGPNPNCLGLLDSVIAGSPFGYSGTSITEILSAGPITLEEGEVIFAGEVIRHVRAGVPAGDGQPAEPRVIVATIATSINDLCKSTINLVETDSAFTGTIATDFLTAPSDVVRVNGEPPANRDWGIQVGTTFSGSITVHCDMTFSSISANQFATGSEVTIGRLLRGVIEARTGTLTSVEVGFRDSPKVFGGTDYDVVLTPAENGDALVDSVIRSPVLIESVKLAGMTKESNVAYRPRVESPEIGTLEIGDFGTLDLNSTFVAGIVRADEEDGFSAITKCKILQGESLADMFVADFTTFDVLYDWGGSIRMPSLQWERILRIGGKLTTVPEFAPTPGRFWVENTGEKTGQLIINAAAMLTPDATFWDGDVDMGPLSGTPPLPPLHFSTDDPSSAVELTPFYRYSMEDMGQGAMGLVPFAVQCRHTGIVASPLYADNGEDCDQQPPTLQSEFSRLSGRTPKRLEIVFYGPVWSDWSLGIGERSPIRVEKDMGLAGWFDLTAQCYIVVSRTPNTNVNRQVTIYGRTAGNLTTMMPSGNYRVRLDDNTSQDKSLYCDWLFEGVAPVEVASSGTLRILAEFALAPDCNGDGVADTAGTCANTGQCPADLDNDGNFPNGGVPDGGVGIDDLLYFLAAFEAGNADLDDGTGMGTPDEATTINDLLYFLWHFEAGC